MNNINLPSGKQKDRHQPGVGLACGALLVLLAGCSDNSTNDMRMARFDQPAVNAVQVVPTSLAVTLHVAANGQGFTPDSLKQLNQMLKDQGRISKQTLTLVPHSVRGEQMAARLTSVLKNVGADAQKVKVVPRRAASGQSGDLDVISEALAVKTPRCGINDPKMQMVKPFEAVGYLGCATQSNLAMMVAEPRDLIQARALDGADGVHAVNSIERYQSDDVKDLIDIDFED